MPKMHPSAPNAAHHPKGTNMKGLLATVLATASLATTLAHADEPTIAQLVEVNGNVLVSRDFNIASAGEAVRLVPGARVLVTANSSVTVVFDGGCRVKVVAGERFEVDAEACARIARAAGAESKEARS